MSLKKFLLRISGKLPVGVVLNMDALQQLDPYRIEVENVRSVLRVPRAIAQSICDIAVRQGVFLKLIAVECPDGSDGAEAAVESDLPETVTCYETENGFVREVELQTRSLRKVTFYRLANG